MMVLRDPGALWCRCFEERHFVLVCQFAVLLRQFDAAG
jgi:hypothetical protein